MFPSLIILPQKLLYRHLLPLLLCQPFVVFPQKPLKVLRPFLSVNDIAHLLRYLRRKVVANDCFPGFIGNPVPNDIIQILDGYHVLQIQCKDANSLYNIYHKSTFFLCFTTIHVGEAKVDAFSF